MVSMDYRLAGAFHLAIYTYREHDVTPAPIDPRAFSQWALSLAREAGFKIRAMAVCHASLELIAMTDSPRSVVLLARWTPRLSARPLHRVGEYYQALDHVVKQSGTFTPYSEYGADSDR